MFVAADETGHHGDAWHLGKGLLYEPVGEAAVKQVLVFLLFGLDEFARVFQHGTVEHGGRDGRAEPFAVAHDGVLCLAASVVAVVAASVVAVS